MAVRFGSGALRPGGEPRNMAGDDKLSRRMLLDQELSTDNGLPVRPGEGMQLTFDTQNGVNDVALEVIVGYVGTNSTSAFIFCR